MTESQHVKRKESWRDEYLKWIWAFTNAQGGVLEVGRDDRGKVVGVKDVPQLLEEIPNKVQSLLSIVVDVNLKCEEGAEYLQIVVGPYPNPISIRGEFHYRNGCTKQVLRGATLSRFLMRKQGRTWDDVPMPGKDATQEIPIPTPESIRTTQEKSEIAQEPNLTTQELTEATQEILPTTQEHTQTTQEGVSQPAPTITPERILALLKAEPRITRRLMAERIGITPHGVKYHLAKLRKAGIIRHVGPTKAGRWEMLK